MLPRKASVYFEQLLIGNAVHQYLDAAISHDEFKHSTQILREYKYSETPGMFWRQPLGFGPMPGPRQDTNGSPYPNRNASTTTATIKFKTSATLLKNMFPSSAYSFSNLDTVATASLQLQILKDLDWLGGGGYELLGFNIHDVQYKQTNGQTAQGTYCPVMFENLTDPILSGREELGFPKLFSDITVTSTSEADLEARLSWRGAEWAVLRWQALSSSPNPQTNGTTTTESNEVNGVSTKDTTEDGASSGNLLVHKFIPSSDSAQRLKSTKSREAADADYTVLFPPSKAQETELQSSQTAEHASFSIQDLGTKKLPTIGHIINRLAEVPVFEVLEATITKEKGIKSWNNGVRLY